MQNTRMQNLKMVIVGDDAVGKSSFLISWCTGTFHGEYVPRDTVLQSYGHHVVVDGKPVNLFLWDFVYLELYDRRHLHSDSYERADISVIGFSIKSTASFENVRSKWFPEVSSHCPDAPIVLVGLKCDLRGQEVEGEEVSREDAVQIAKDIGAVGYYETSALTGAGVSDAVNALLKAKLKILQKSEGGRQRFKLPWRRSSRASDKDFSTNAYGNPPPPKLPAKEKAPRVKIPTSTFASDWSKLVDNPSHSDVVFKLSSKVYHTHRYVLTSASDLFRQLFGIKEKVKVDCLGDGWSKSRVQRVSREAVNSGQLEGLLLIEERPDSDGRERTEVTFDPNIVTEVALSRVLTFLYTGVVELDKETEGLDEIIKISQLLNLPELAMLCENARKGEMCVNTSIERNISVAKQLFLNKYLFSDVCFVVEGVVVPAHRLVLSTRCQFMAAMLSGSFQESTATQITIPDIPLDTFLSFLEYLYTDHAPMKEGNSLGILELANRYVMKRLMCLCELYISKHVERATKGSIAKADVDIIGLLLSAQLHNASQLSSWCLHFISSNYVAFVDSDGFAQLEGDNLSHVQEHRWPPLSYETAMDEYKRKYLDTEGEGSGDTKLSEGAVAQTSKKSKLSQLIKRKNRIEYYF